MFYLLSFLLDGFNVGSLNQTLGWTCYVKVDNTTYTAMGSPGNVANNLTTQIQTEVCLIKIFALVTNLQS